MDGGRSCRGLAPCYELTAISGASSVPAQQRVGMNRYEGHQHQIEIQSTALLFELHGLGGLNRRMHASVRDACSARL